MRQGVALRRALVVAWAFLSGPATVVVVVDRRQSHVVAVLYTYDTFKKHR